MAKLSELTSCFMEAFLKANPNSLVDSNGYLRSEYEAELARRKQPVVESNGVPDPRTYRPQFECTGEIVTVFETSDETIPAFESPDEQLGITKIAHLESDGTWLDDGRKYGPMIRADGEIVTPQLLADSTKWNTPLSVLVEPSQEKLETVADSIAGYDHYKFSDPRKSGIGAIKQLGDEGYLTQEQMEAILTAPLVVTTTPAPPIAEGAQRLRFAPDLPQPVAIEPIVSTPAEPVEYVDTAAYELYELTQQAPTVASVEESTTLDYIALDDITPEATIAQAESDAGIDGEPAASEPHE